MTGRRERDKQLTRERISQVATELFLTRGFEEVTVAQVAAAAGVSKVTLFAHFARKEDLLLDLAPEAVQMVRAAIGDRQPGVDPLQALRELALSLASRRHPLSGLRDGVEPFLRTVAASPALAGRAWELLAEVEQALAAALADGHRPTARSRLLAALVIAAYRTAMVETVHAVLAGRSGPRLVTEHRRRVNAAFDAVQAAAGTLPA